MTFRIDIKLISRLVLFRSVTHESLEQATCGTKHHTAENSKKKENHWMRKTSLFCFNIDDLISLLLNGSWRELHENSSERRKVLSDKIIPEIQLVSTSTTTDETTKTFLTIPSQHFSLSCDLSKCFIDGKQNKLRRKNSKGGSWSSLTNNSFCFIFVDTIKWIPNKSQAQQSWSDLMSWWMLHERAISMRGGVWLMAVLNVGGVRFYFH